ncbi:MAG TPA: hypothetical protein VF173_29165 [Thermoanaerobaculia bacterium]|nr:hypothetical protein [Thermoanaerobaculia bacterium]
MRPLWIKMGMAIALLATAAAVPASGATLYWASTAVHTNSIRTCFSFANTSMHALNFQNIRQSASEVAGSAPGAYAAVTCIGTSPRVTAVVMVAGENGNLVAQARDNLRNKIAGIVQID